MHFFLVPIFLPGHFLCMIMSIGVLLLDKYLGLLHIETNQGQGKLVDMFYEIVKINIEMILK